jgi:hypothetical protein
MIHYDAEPVHLADCPSISLTPLQERVLEAVKVAATQAGLMMTNLTVVTVRGCEDISPGVTDRTESGAPEVYLDGTLTAREFAHVFAHELSHVSDYLRGQFENPNDPQDDERRADEFGDYALKQRDVVSAIEAAGGGPLPRRNGHHRRRVGPVSRLADCPVVEPTTAQRRILDVVIAALPVEGLANLSGRLRIFPVHGAAGLPPGETLRARETGRVTVWLDATASPRVLARALAEQLIHVGDVWSGRPFDRESWERRARQFAGRVLGRQDVLNSIADAERGL